MMKSKSKSKSRVSIQIDDVFVDSDVEQNENFGEYDEEVLENLNEAYNELVGGVIALGKGKYENKQTETAINEKAKNDLKKNIFMNKREVQKYIYERNDKEEIIKFENFLGEKLEIQYIKSDGSCQYSAFIDNCMYVCMYVCM
jgi:hypothetical protein